MTVLFIGSTFYVTFINVGVFILFLMVSGSIYGITYSSVLYFKNREKVSKDFQMAFSSKFVRSSFVVGGILFLIGYFNFLFFVFGAIVFIFPVLYFFAKSLEQVVMIGSIAVKDLREGDWLVNDLKVGGRVIKADWDGLSNENIGLIRKLRGGKVKIKEGLPFAPAFLIAFLLYIFTKDYFIGILMGS